MHTSIRDRRHVALRLKVQPGQRLTIQQELTYKYHNTKIPVTLGTENKKSQCNHIS